MKVKITILASILVAIFACSPKTSPATSTKQTTTIDLTPDLIAAKISYENNCAKCHKLYSAKEYTAVEWKPILERMQVKAKITDQEREKIYSYLTMK